MKPMNAISTCLVSGLLALGVGTPMASADSSPKRPELEVVPCNDSTIQDCGEAPGGGGGDGLWIVQCSTTAGDLGFWYGCVSGRPPATPEAHARAYIGATHPASGHTCTGSKQEMGSGTAGGTVGGGLVVSGSVSASVTVTIATHYDFACDYSMYAVGWGEKGFLRHVQAKVAIGGGPFTPVSAGCGYDGAREQSCLLRDEDGKVLSDAFSGSGIAGPGSGNNPLWPLPTQVTVCPPGGENARREQVWNDGAQGVGLGTVDSAVWACQAFAIHYLN